MLNRLLGNGARADRFRVLLESTLRPMLPRAWRAHLAESFRPFGRIAEGEGAGLYFDPGPSNPTYRLGTNELPVQRLMARHLKQGGVLYDIGANVGFFTVIGARLAGPTGRVYAFEPVTANAKYLRRNARRNRFENVTICQEAVSDRTGRATLQLASYAGGSALSVAEAPPDLIGTLEVDTVTIDDMIATAALRSPTLIKIDVEGAEAQVLIGMRHTLAVHRPIVILELDDRLVSGLAAKQRTCERLLHEAGYEIDRIQNSYPNEHWLVAHFLARPL